MLLKFIINVKNCCRSIARMSALSFKLSKPNILIVTESSDDFKRLKAYIQELLGKTSYTIYCVGGNDLQVGSNAAVWRANCVLLVTCEKKKSSSPSDFYLDYLKQGGRILSLPSSDGGSDDGEKFEFESTYESDPSIQRFNIDKAIYQYNHQPSLGVHLILKVIIDD